MEDMGGSDLNSPIFTCWLDNAERLHLWLQRNTVNALSLSLVAHVGIDLGGLDILVSEYSLDDIDACSGICLK